MIGVYVKGAPKNTVGGTTAGARNIISGNSNFGVYIHSGASDNKVMGNYIGTDKTGTVAMGNDVDGVLVYESASSNTIGDTDSDAGNLISGNGSNGVDISGGASGNSVSGNSIHSNGGAGVQVRSGAGNRVLSNSIFSNTGLGIDLAPNGVTANDIDDPDTGANNLQNFPDIISATKSGATTTITGTLNSTPDQTYTIECFLTETGGDSSGHGGPTLRS